MPIVNPIWFYLADFFNELNVLSWIFIIACGIGFVICFMIGSDEYDKNRTFFYALSKKFGIATIVFMIIIAVSTSSDTVKEMAVASVVTYENVATVKGEATELIDYIIDSVDKLNDNKE